MLNNFIIYLILLILIIIISDFSTTVEKKYPKIIHIISDEPLYKFLSLCIIILILKFNFKIGILVSLIFLFIINDIGFFSNINN
jgi:hypothetical protein